MQAWTQTTTADFLRRLENEQMKHTHPHTTNFGQAVLKFKLDILGTLDSDLEIVEKLRLSMSTNFLTTGIIGTHYRPLHQSVSFLSLKDGFLASLKTTHSLVSMTPENLGPSPDGNPTGSESFHHRGRGTPQAAISRSIKECGRRPL